MEFLIKAGQLILSLSILIVLHEFGHYLPARWFKTRVEKFYLFFDYKFSIFKKKIGETEWGIGWIPLGGYVKISGMIDESMDKEQMKQEPKEWEFRSKPAWQRLIIMVGGVVVNMILGILIYMMVLFAWGEDYLDPTSVENGYSFHEYYEGLGFQDGDDIKTIDGTMPFDVGDINKMILLRGAKEFVVDREGAEVKIVLPEDVDMEAFKQGAIGGIVPRFGTEVDSVYVGYPGEAAGMKNGDVILSVNGIETPFWDVFREQMEDKEEETLVLEVDRMGEILTFEVTADSVGQIGVLPVGIPEDLYSHKSYSFGESIPGGFDLGITTLSDYATQLKFLFTSKGASSIGGFGTFGSLFSPTWDWKVFWSMTAFISIMLAFMNILPIPALDGGHIMFLLYEMISGRKPNEKVMEYAQFIGIIIILGLVLFANGNDIYRAIFGG